MAARRCTSSSRRSRLLGIRNLSPESRQRNSWPAFRTALLLGEAQPKVCQVAGKQLSDQNVQIRYECQAKALVMEPASRCTEAWTDDSKEANAAACLATTAATSSQVIQQNTSGMALSRSS